MKDNNFLEWREGYILGIKDLDNQHKELISLINKLLRRCEEGNDEYESFNELVLITIEHFKNHFEYEEKLMIEKKYPHYEEHKREHDRLLEKIKNMGEKMINRQEKKQLKNLVIFMREWILETMEGSDKQMGEYFNE